MKHFNQIFFHKKELRKIWLFSFFKKASSQGVQLTELLIAYPYSRKTFHSDMKELRQDLVVVYKNQILIEQENGIYRLDNESKISSQKLILYYAKRSRDFSVFHTIAKNRKASFSYLTTKLYYSQSSIYNSMKKLNVEFESVGVSCSTNGLSGEEKKIRHLLFESYWSGFAGIEWPFDVPREQLVQEIKKLEELGIRLNELEKEKILYWLAVTEIRLSKGNSIIDTGDKSISRKNRTILFQSFFELSSNEYSREYNFEDEEAFLISTIYFLRDHQVELQEQDNQLNCVIKIEKYLKLRGANSGLSQIELNQFQKQLIKINYYLKENLIDLYHFLEPKAKSYYEENFILMEDDWHLLQKDIYAEISSIYVLAAKNNGVSLVKPLRIHLVSKEGRTSEIGHFFKKYSDYPIEITHTIETETDILLTDFLSGVQQEELKPKIFVYEWPVTDAQLQTILSQAIDSKKRYLSERVGNLIASF
ncbi:hypothetical protein CMALT430_20075 [Carnobacterium maltaromaticum]|uniref:helix-turn-helix domain-containing protein n=1 Tax=Carnobacterium maltaromaticum TaxID=2751 RepID=UPI00191BADE8|nr:helix-turn-helix domain-containing protein [Carnobacterium maltaromaticum]CAD5898847.1 hypothetical protein CMALT430_20075 [Carnobacterium maltaromaticum]